MSSEIQRSPENILRSWKVYMAVAAAAVALFGSGLAVSEEFRSRVGEAIELLTPDIIDGPVYDPTAPPHG